METSPGGIWPPPPPPDPEGWRTVVLGQVSRDILPPHPEPPEAEQDELTLAALSDPADVRREEGDPNPTFWRVLVVVLVAVAALSIVFRLGR